MTSDSAGTAQLLGALLHHRLDYREREVNEFRLLVTGSRAWDDRFRLDFELNTVAHHIGELGMTLKLIVGDCPTGADKMALDWAKDEECALEVFKAEWDEHGKVAGPLRNVRMVVDGKPMMALAFLKDGVPNKGTEHCAGYAEANHVPVRRIVD